MAKSVRKAISKKARFEIFKRDGFACQYCGTTPPAAVLHVDHIVPVVGGGKNDADNLVTACESCNQGKGARSLSDVPQSLKDKASDVKEREEQLRGYQEIMDARHKRLDGEMWRVAEVLQPGCSQEGFRRDWLRTVREFVERLGVHEVLDAASITRAKLIRSPDGQFRYFCGVCWRKFKGD